MSVADVSPNEKYSRCVALEEDYVHQVYEKIGKDLVNVKDPLEVTVKNFLDDLEPGSLVADVGCGDGRHLRNTNGIFSLGADSSCLQASLARQRCQEALLGNNLRLPFRGDAFDAVLSVGVIHHFTTRERRITAIKELARILKIGGKILIAVQRQNTQNSQDVLIPWFDVPKTKKPKDACWLDQDSGEYELEDDRDEDDDNDSISLPSSDEDDDPLTTYAKFIPPHSECNGKYGWLSERQTRSLDYDYQASSNYVPKQLVHTNPCYSFVRKALKRFSSANASDEDPYCEQQLHSRGDSAVPPSPMSVHEQKIDYLDSSSSEFNESLQKNISENVIELLNIDDEGDTSCFLHERESTRVATNQCNLVCDSPTNKNKSTLMRSLSDMFKNINSLWSSKETKSCSDLKSHASSNDYLESEKQYSRLVRSKTTATCKPEVEYFSSLESIAEIDMSVTEANKIINAFLESSMPSIKSVKLRSETPDQELSSLTHSDIVNGNTLPCTRDLQTTHIIQGNLSRKLKLNGDLKNFEDAGGLKKKRSYADSLSIKSNDDDVVLFSSNNKFDDSFESKRTVYKNILPDSEEIKDKTEVLPNIGTDNLSSDIVDDLKHSATSSIDGWNSKPQKIVISQSEKVYSRDSLNSERLQTSLLQNSQNQYLNEKKNEVNLSAVIDNLDFIFKEKQTPQIPEENHISSKNTRFNLKNNEHINEQKEQFEYAKDILSYNSIICNSSKQLLNMVPNYSYQITGSRTLGPFFDEDDSHIEEEYSNLSSYYSMPELHALSDFYQKCSIYKNDLVSNSIGASEFQKQYSEEQNAKYDSHVKLVGKSNSTTKTDSCAELNSNNKILGKNLDRDILNKDIKRCLINSVLETSSADQKLVICNMDNRALSRNIYSKNEKELLSFTSAVNPKLKSVFNSSTKCKSLISINTVKDQEQVKNSIIATTAKTISRSHSIDQMPKEINLINSFGYSETPLCQLSSLHTFKSSDNYLNPKNAENVKPNTNDFQKNLTSIDLSCGILENSLTDSYGLHHNNKLIEKDIYNRHNKCALFQENLQSGRDSVTRSLSGKQKLQLHPYFDAEKLNCNETYNSSQICSLQNNPSYESSKIHSSLSKGNRLSQVVTEINILENGSFALSPDQKYFRHVNSENNKVNDSHFPGDETLSLKDSFDTMEKQFLENGSCNVFEFPKDTIYSKHVHEAPTTKKEIANSNKCQENTLCGNITNISSLHFLQENISENKPNVSLIHPDLVCSKMHISNGSKTNIKTEIPTYGNVSPSSSAVSENILSTFVEAVPSQDSAAKGLNRRSCNDVDKQKCMNSSKSSYQENINYTYGHVHEDGAVVVSHRYHHLFKEEELDEIIENNIHDLHVLHSFQYESHWCIIAEKVRVWTI